jgi:hypothetical protein
MQQTLSYTLRKPKFQSICNFCNKDLKLACFVFSNIFHLVQIICVEIVLPIVSISDILKSELCRVLMSGDSGLWAAVMVEFLFKQLEAFFFIHAGCIFT